MATCKEVLVNKDNFMCSICLEVYTKPRTLRCLHSFCHKCLVKYMQLFVGKLKYKCPMCSKEYSAVPAVPTNVNKWVEQFPVNFTLDTLAAQCKNTDEPENASINKTFCEPCLNDDKPSEVAAAGFCLECNEHLCKLCKSCHKRSKATRSHTIVEIEDQSEKEEFNVLRCLTECPEHKGENVMYLCKTHDVICCHKCIIPDHQKCDGLVYLQDVVKESEPEKREKVSNLSVKVTSLENHVQDLTKQNLKQKSVAENSEVEVKKYLNHFKKKLDASFNKVKEAVLEDMGKQKMELLKKMDEREESLEAFKTDIKSAKSQLDLVSKYGKPLHHFMIERKLRDDIESLDSSVKSDSISVPVVLKKFSCRDTTSDTTIEKYLMDAMKLEICDDELVHPDIHYAHEARKPHLIAMFELTKKEYKGRINARSCAWVGDFIVVAVQGPNCLLCVDLTKNQVISTYQCDSSPLSVRTVRENKVAVCLPDVGQVLTLTVNEGVLNIAKTLRVTPQTTDFLPDTKQSRWIYQVPEEETVSVCNSSGNVISQFELSTICHEADKNVHYIDFDPETQVLYVSCFDSKKLVAFDITEGNVVFEYKHQNLQYPCYPTVDAEGNIYIPSTGNTAHSIHQINRQGKYIRQILEGEIMLPWCMRFHKDMNKFAVTDNSRDAQLKIYELK